MRLGASEDAQLEINSYLYAHVPDSQAEAGAAIRRVLIAGARSPHWDFTPNIDRAREAGDPRVDFLVALSGVIAERAPIDSLEPFAEWQPMEAD